MPPIITASLLRWHAQCTRHIWLHTNGDSTQQTDLGTGVVYSLEQGQRHERQVHEATTHDIRTIPAENWADAVTITQDLMNNGSNLILGASLEAQFHFPDYDEPLTIRGKVDRIQKVHRRQHNLPYPVSYYPIEIKHYDEIGLADTLQLDLYIWLLRQRLQEHLQHGEFWLSADVTSHPQKRIPHEYNEERLMNHLHNVARLMHQATVAPPIRLRPHCDSCHWKQDCTQKAQEQQSITLLRPREETLEDMANAGIHTLSDVLQTDEKTLTTFRQVGKATAHKLRAKAQAYLENRPIVMQTPPAITREEGWYFDIETHPHKPHWVWSIGWRWQTDESQVILVIPHCEPSTLTLPDGRIIQAVPDSHSAWEFFHDSVIANHQPIYHWTKFDTGNLKKLGPSWVHDALKDRFHDLHQSFTQSIQLPTHSNSLKVVAPFAGFHWRAHQSWHIAWMAYGRFLQTRRESHLVDACQYQTDDVDAMVAVRAWMQVLGQTHGFE
jgi:predicted RecB family nuclease